MTSAIENLPKAAFLRTHDRSYDAIARSLHWTVVGLLLLQVAVGWLMPEIERTTPQEGLVAWHLSIGAALMFLMFARLAWKLTHPVSPYPKLQHWERRISGATHSALYLLLFLIPLLGWASAGYNGYTVRLFGAVTLRALADKTMAWADVAGEFHAGLVNVLLAVVGLHVAGAMYHHFVRRDGVLQRMLPTV